MISINLHNLISWLIDMHQKYGGCARCMQAIHAVNAPVVPRCIHCAFYDMTDDGCMFNQPMQGAASLAAWCDFFQRENLTDCYRDELD